MEYDIGKEKQRRISVVLAQNHIFLSHAYVRTSLTASYHSAG